MVLERNMLMAFPSSNKPQIHSPDGALPPLIVAMHGGPTWQEGPGVYMRDQFWTTRGHALVQVNYVGSSGYCKEYINLLNLQWGVNDVADAVKLCGVSWQREASSTPTELGL